MGRVLEGFQVSGLASMQSGHPFTVLSGVDTLRTGRIGYADVSGDPFGRSDTPNEIPGLKTIITNPGAFSVPADGSIGAAGRNSFYGPSFVSFDLSVAKKMQLTERIAWEFRIEGYNIFNHPNFLNPGTDNSLSGNILNSGLFGIVTATAGSPDGTTGARQLQVGMKLVF